MQMKLGWLALVIVIGCGGSSEREEKDEYLQHVDALGGRIETLNPGSSDEIVLESENYGWVIVFTASGARVGAGTLEVCVNSTGSAAITYFPHFSPGFDFVDTDPGCTEITNPDPTLENDVLVEVTGTGTVTISTQLLP